MESSRKSGWGTRGTVTGINKFKGMVNNKLNECLRKEINFRTSRASGPGGQHVNKTESRVVLVWDLEHSACLDDNQKKKIGNLLASRLTEQGTLWLASEKYRSQYRNKEEVTERFLELLRTMLVPEKKRYPTRPGRKSIEQRIRKKKIRGELKRNRRWKPEG